MTIRLLAVATMMTAVLAGLVGHHAYRRSSGTEVLLEMEPVDPRDVLLGHYVILTTPVHRLDTGALEGPETGWARGDLVYVALEETAAGAALPVGAFREAPGGLFIRGRVQSVSTQQEYTEPEPLEDGSIGWRREPVPGTQRDELWVQYNIERYYAPQDQALALERQRNEDRLRLIVSVGDDGGAVIKGLEIDGERRIDRLF
ncbi:MAG: GDYXXLXY domain-containing protein [Oceanicaulis sp.]